MNTVVITVEDRGTLVGLHDPNAYALLDDSFGWLRDITAKGLRSVADGTDVLASEIGKIYSPELKLADALRERDSWEARFFAEVLDIVALLNPLTLGKEVAIWILEDFRDILRALAVLVDTHEETAEETQEALFELGMSAAALVIPYVGRAGKTLYRMLSKFSGLKGITKFIDTEKGMAMLRYISEGDVLAYLKKLDFPAYAGKVKDFLWRLFAKLEEVVGRLAPKISAFARECVTKLGRWIDNIMQRIQQWMKRMIGWIKAAVYGAATNITNPAVLNKIPDQVLDWVAGQINGNLAESCVDNYFMNFMGYDRLHPSGGCERDVSAFFAPERGIDGLYEYPVPPPPPPCSFLPDTYNGVPNSLGWVLEEMDLEIEDTTVKKGLMGAAARAFKPFGSVKAAFHPVNPTRPPRFVVAEMKFGYHAKEGKPLTDKEWKGRLGTSDDGKQMSKKWIDGRLQSSLSQSKYNQIFANYARWLYGAQPVKAENSKKTKSKKGKLMGLAYFPPYALRGFDMDKLGW